MSWSQERLGHYCDGCDCRIAFGTRAREPRRTDPPAEQWPGPLSGDPYVAVTLHSFPGPNKHRQGEGFMYCFDCWPGVEALLRGFNR